MIDGDEKPTRDTRLGITGGSNEEGAICFGGSDAPDQRTSTGVIQLKNAHQVCKAARQSLRSVWLLRIGVLELPGRADADRVSCVEIDASIDPSTGRRKVHLAGLREEWGDEEQGEKRVPDHLHLLGMASTMMCSTRFQILGSSSIFA